MRNRNGWAASAALCGYLCSSLLIPVVVKAQNDTPVSPGESVDTKGALKADANPTMKTDTVRHSPTTTANTMPPPGSDERADMVMQNARLVVDTLSEEKTEINTLKAQAMAFRKMKGSSNKRIANLLDRMRREHEAASPGMMKLATSLGGDPMSAKIMKPPVIGAPSEMMHATHMDHMKAVQTSQMRWKMSNDYRVRAAMNKRANLARKHIRWMKPYHDRMMRHGAIMKDGMDHSTHGMKTM